MARTLTTQCCVVGGGPAGVMLGLLLARAGVQVTVLEKHGDFLRDFRGDTIHPSSMQVLQDIGLLDAFLELPHQKARHISLRVGGTQQVIADLGHLRVREPYIAMVPQWDFLDFLTAQAAAHPGFSLRMRTAASGLIEENGRTVGVRATDPEGDLEIRADLVVAADGRNSVLREASRLGLTDFGAPIDVLWFRINRRPDDPAEIQGTIQPGRMMVMINRTEHWQCAWIIPKNSLGQVKAAGLDAFRDGLGQLAPFLGDRVDEVTDWDDLKLLTVRIDRLERWHRPGLLFIGDAAHAMSPVGGVGINLAIQDAVAAANLLAVPLRESRATETDLHAVQRRRELPTRLTQRLQALIHDNVFGRVLRTDQPFTRPPLALRLLGRFPLLRRIPARVFGMGFRPERVTAPVAEPTS